MSEEQQLSGSIASVVDKASQCVGNDFASKIVSAIGKEELAMPRSSAPMTPSYMELSQDITLKDPWHQLIILGNGFDLECGLKSSFGDFVTARKNYFLDANPSDEDPVFRKTIWDYILSDREGANWCDIEGAIAEWVAPKDPRHDPKTPLDLSSSLVVFGKTLKKLNELNGLGYGIQLNTNEAADRIADYLSKRFYGKRTQWNKEELLDLTQEDLTTFECDFASYLSSEINRKPDYQQAAEALLKNLIRIGLPNASEHEIGTSVLSFNYTSPKKFIRVDDNLASYVNIHGKLGCEIVFGIDGTGRMNNLDALPYTKTYRLMALDVPNIGSIVHRRTMSFSSQTHGAVDVIKFYGHSLGEADYSYFQAIFDAVNLYDGLTRLQFFIRPYAQRSVEEVREEMMGKVIRLLNGYGETLDNKDHGKNLIHKLLIEGRLQIVAL